LNFIFNLFFRFSNSYYYHNYMKSAHIISIIAAKEYCFQLLVFMIFIIWIILYCTLHFNYLLLEFVSIICIIFGRFIMTPIIAIIVIIPVSSKKNSNVQYGVVLWIDQLPYICSHTRLLQASFPEPGCTLALGTILGPAQSCYVATFSPTAALLEEPTELEIEDTARKGSWKTWCCSEFIWNLSPCGCHTDPPPHSLHSMGPSQCPRADKLYLLGCACGMELSLFTYWYNWQISQDTLLRYHI
jgi:hypothetical protein